ncbi:MAG TPA: biopolymer transporter ExbD [Bdellovibrionota bacterium]|jgi:biopolymer transport protein ExbD|nr:biopolymer transporter ExbD [Bdellovibrionota bacterium]
MGIQIPGYRLVSGHDLPEMRARLKGANRHRALTEELTLTSLIDMFSVIILFLIQSFSVTGEVMFLNKDLQVPYANHGRILERSPIITITPEKVTVEGLAAGDNAGIEDKIEEEDWNLPLMSEKLIAYKTFFESIHNGEPFPGEVILQADQELDFLYIKRVMFSLVKIGFNNINLVVRGEAFPEAYAGEEAHAVDPAGM